MSDGKSAPEGLTDVVREACKECKGLPLALRVIGASFRDVSSLDAWQSRLAKMRDSVPPDEDTKKELYGRLRLSVDHLPFPILKELFVDFAAYPEDHLISIRRLVDTWAVDPRIGSTERALISLSILLSRSLVEFSPTGPERLDYSHPYEWTLGFCRVHDLLRDVAVQLASEEVDQRRRKQLFFVGKGSFDPCAGEYKAVKIAFHGYEGSGGSKYLDLVQLQKSLKAPHLQVLEMRDMHFAESETWVIKWRDSNRLSKRVAGIAAAAFVRCAQLFVGERHTAAKWHRGFTHCPSLRVLEGTHDGSWGPCDVGNESLRVLRWGICPHDMGLLARPVYLGHHRRLQVLELNPEGFPKFSLKVPTASLRSMLRLRTLRISGGHSEWLSSLAHMSWLEELHLHVSVSRSAKLTYLESLVSLKVLNLSYNLVLEALPENLCSLQKLQELDISMTSIKTLPSFLGDLPVLESITAKWCNNIDATTLGGEGKFASLLKLDLSGCGAPSFPKLSENAMRKLQVVVWKGDMPIPPETLTRRQQGGLQIVRD